MPHSLAALPPDWQSAGLALAMLLLAVGAVTAWRMRKTLRLLTAALDHVPQPSAGGRLPRRAAR